MNKPALEIHYCGLSHLLRPEFYMMTFPAYAAQLSRDSFFGIEAWHGEEPAGMALANRVSPSEAELLSIFVRHDCRRQKVATRMLELLLKAAAQMGLEKMSAILMLPHEHSHALKSMFASPRWSRPVRRMLILKTTLDAIKQAPWLRLSSTLPPGASVTTWAGISPQSKAALAREQAESPWIPSLLSPFEFERGHDPATSMALLQDGRIIGWLLSHRLGTGAIRFSCVYAHPSTHGLARIVQMITAAIRASEEAGYERASWAISYRQRRMVEFAERHLAPWCTFRGETMSVSCNIQAAVK